ncbi:hypothetical protein D3C83_125530 [compost metagenome]
MGLRAISDDVTEDLPSRLQNVVEQDGSGGGFAFAVIGLALQAGVPYMWRMRTRLVRSSAKLEADLREFIKTFLLDKSSARP